jgi:hypothetical protein
LLFYNGWRQIQTLISHETVRPQTKEVIRMKTRTLVTQIGTRMIFVVSVLFIMVTLAVPSSNLAQETKATRDEVDCSIPAKFIKSRPHPRGTPTPVQIGLLFIDIDAINDAKQTYNADAFGLVSWNDPRLSEESLGRSLEDCRVMLNEIWHPYPANVNRVKAEKILQDFVDIDKNGTVSYRQRYSAELSSDFDFRNFPFDTQVLKAVIVIYGQDADEIVLSADKKSTGMRKEISVEGWNIELEDPVISTEYMASQSLHVPRIDFRLSAERVSGYYLWKVIVPLGFIVLMAWCVFWIDPSQIGPQIGVSTATVFTLIAYRFSLGFLLPRVAYLTKMDKFVLLSTVLVFLALGEAIMTGKVAVQGKKDMALRIDRWARVIYLILFAIVITFSLLV